MNVRMTSVAMLAALATAACGGEDGTTDNKGFDPPPVSDGYTRIVAPLIEGIEPGADVMLCQHIFAPQDRDLDILDVQGFQSRSSHHAVAYAVTNPKPVGTTEPCSEGSSMEGVYVGGIGGEGGGGMVMPEGTAFRLPKGHGILLNAHFINTTQGPLTGQSVLDFKFADADPSRKVLSNFTNMDMGFALVPGVETNSQAECTFPEDMELLMVGNHMHHRGTKATTEVIRAGSTQVEILHDDPIWAAEMEYRAPFTTWTTSDPLVIKKGDVLRTRCTWMNDTAETLRFPAEMCIGIGFFLSDGTSSPTCINGTWLERGGTL